ncbi:uncharacterized protein LOC121976192 isoform X1 [Zingiber officinale]|uniref:uncharacterized protein LOC121976192 isoform X1 n=1 Tax=Zingiber officinale TaxID=94328 RepID=UPI001C4ACA21|nr:uncharacterized protein LOC121976192 isoform X1 [Zingiber officinale]XP_042384192.1 uncharacterized protein LOC121976192 isoform X1 [Zingiber officinale]XP_042384193.1 uncharacterized protein LOC121976192 isoform X1 [Zingiber officinale]
MTPLLRRRWRWPPPLFWTSSRRLSLRLGIAMLGRLAARGSTAKALLRCPKSVPPLLTASAAVRFFSTGGGDASSPPERLALEMTQYALGLARSQKSGDSYSHAMLVLEQGMSNLREGGGGAVEGTSSSDNAMGMILLALSTLLYERGQLQDANEKLEMVHQLGRASIDLIVAACEGRVGLNLETGQDANSLLLADNCSHLLRASEEGGVPVSEVTKFRAKSIKGLVDLINGDCMSVESVYGGSKECGMGRTENQLGTSLLSQGEISHCIGNFSLSKELYEKALLTLETKKTSSMSYLASTNMVPEEVTIGAACALGQLLSHSGNFAEAEEQLTKALVKAEEHFGSTHPKVGVILTCIAIMYKRKAQVEASSSIIIQEGLYRKATDLLKAPDLNEKVVALLDRRDIIALARGGYADLLCIQQNRKEEGERMKQWAESMWRNKRLSLAEALEFPEPTKAAVVDTRTCRVL